MAIEIGLLANQLIWGVLVGVTYSLLAMAFSLIYSTSNTVNFATGEFAMLAAYFCYTAMSQMDGNILAGVVVAMVGIFIFGMLVERIAFRRLYKLDPILILIATIGVSTIIKNTVLVIWGPFSQSLPPIFKADPIVIGKIILVLQNLALLAIGLLVMVVFHIFMQHTKIGRAMRATAQNPKGAALVGINTDRCINLSWGIGSVVAGIGGMLLAFAYNLSIDMGTLIGIKGFAGAIIGGFGSITASTFGGLVLGVIENMSAVTVSFYYKDVIAFAFVVLILLVKPSGLFVTGGGQRKI